MNYVKIGKFEKISNIDVLNAKNSPKEPKILLKKTIALFFY